MNTTGNSDTIRPNLFDFATSELSQDAFLAWLLTWADLKFESVDAYCHQLGKRFVQSLLGKSKDYVIEHIKVKKQWKNIDVCAIINNEHFIVIEDKKATLCHSDQLNTYKKVAEQEYGDTNHSLHLVYFKMEEQGNYNSLEEAGYKRFKRDTMLNILAKYIHDVPSEEKNNIIVDYYEHLVSLDNKINSYLNVPTSKLWSQLAWQGFYTSLQKNKLNGAWHKVNNPQGGFLAFYWHYLTNEIDNTKFDSFLQLEQNKLTIRITLYSETNRQEIRNLFESLLFKNASNLGIGLKKHGRLGKGKKSHVSLSVAVLESDYRILNTQGKVDIIATVKYLKTIMSLLDKTKAELTLGKK